MHEIVLVGIPHPPSCSSSPALDDNELAPTLRRINADVLDVMEKLLDSLKTDREVDARVKESTVEDSGSDGERRARLADLALQAGLPKASESAVPFSAFSWDATPHLRLSREGISGGQFLVSSGRPLRSGDRDEMPRICKGLLDPISLP